MAGKEKRGAAAAGGELFRGRPWVLTPDDPAELDAWELKEVDVGTLAQLWFGILRRIDGGGPRTVIVDDVPLGVRIAKLVEQMRDRGEGRLSELFAAEPTHIGRVATWMSVKPARCR